MRILSCHENAVTNEFSNVTQPEKGLKFRLKALEVIRSNTVVISFEVLQW
jgi:hypothetical protein